MANRKSERDRLVEENQRLAFREAAKVAQTTGLEFEDLAQEAMKGLIRAAEKFDPSRGLAFSTYAVPSCRGAILSYVRARGWRVYTPHRWRELWARGRKLMEQGLKEEAIAAALDLSLDSWREIRQAHTASFIPVKEVLLADDSSHLDRMASDESDELLERIEESLEELSPAECRHLLDWVSINARLTHRKGRKISFPRPIYRKLCIAFAQGKRYSFNRKDMVRRLCQRFPMFSPQQLDRLVGVLFEELGTELTQGSVIRFRGFGALELSAHRGSFRAAKQLKTRFARVAKLS